MKVDLFSSQRAWYLQPMPVQTFPWFYETLQSQQVCFHRRHWKACTSILRWRNWWHHNISFPVSRIVFLWLTPNAVLVGIWMRLVVTHTNFSQLQMLYTCPNGGKEESEMTKFGHTWERWQISYDNECPNYKSLAFCFHKPPLHIKPVCWAFCHSTSACNPLGNFNSSWWGLHISSSW